MSGQRTWTACVAALLVACSSSRHVPAGSAAQAPTPSTVERPSGPLRLAYIGEVAAPEVVVTIGSDGMQEAGGKRDAWPQSVDEDVGVFGYALGETVITSATGAPLGRLAPDARVSVSRVITAKGNTAERAEIVLFPWTAANGASEAGPLHAFVPARALAATPVGRDGTVGAPAREPKMTGVISSLPLRDGRWETLAYTFCGSLDVLGPSSTTGLSRVEQTEEGVTLAGLVEDGELAAAHLTGDESCMRSELLGAAGRPLLIREAGDNGVTRFLAHGHGRRYTGSGTPSGLVATDLRGPKLASFAAKKKTISWVVDGGFAPRCESWTFGPAHAAVTPLTIHRQLANGQERVASVQTTVIPGSTASEEVISVTGVACNRRYVVVGSDATSFTLLAAHVRPGVTVLAYSPADAERWFTDKEACDAALTGGKDSYAALGFSPHDACE